MVIIIFLLLLLFCASDLNAQTPTYISGLSDYQVRNLSGSFAPTNGTLTITSVTPSEWQTSDPIGALAGIIAAWSGGYKAIAGTKLYVFGGGHSDSANNGIYTFDFSGTGAPVGWTLPTQSAVAAVTLGSPTTNSDGKGVAVHTYDGTIYVAANNSGYRFGGAQANPSGVNNAATLKYNFTTNTHTVLANHPSGNHEYITMYDPVSGKIMVGQPISFSYAVFNTNTDTWSASKTTAVSFSPSSPDLCAAYDTSRSRGVILGGGSGNARLVTMNWTTEVATLSSITPTGSTGILNANGPSCFYDSGRDVYWIFGGGAGSSGWTNIYEMHPTTYAITAHALTGDAISQMSGMIGSYGRFVWMPAYRAIGTIANTTSAASIIKLPAATGAALNVGSLAHDGPATPEQLSLILPITGTLATGATATVRYKPSASSTWVTGHPLYRINTNPSITLSPDVGTLANAFAWPIIDLTPGTAYDVEVTVSDGTTTEIQNASFTTRALPAAAGAANKTITAGSSTATIQTALDNLNPGDVIQFQNGTYTLTTQLQLNRSGTSGNPFIIRGQSRGGVIVAKSSSLIWQILDASNWIMENLTIQGSGVDSGVNSGSVGIEFWNGASGRSNITIRNLTMTGVDKAVNATNEITSGLVYNNTLTGNNTWVGDNCDSNGNAGAPDGILDIDENCYWNDDGINWPGYGNAVFNNTLTGFGDSISYAQHSGGNALTETNGVHVYRNDIINGGDDGTEVDYASRNNTFYDNRITNSMTFLSLDPIFGGPFLAARNISINSGRQPFKFNSRDSGMFIYNNTILHTTTRYAFTDPPAEAGWYQANNGCSDSMGYRNNIMIYSGNGTRQTRLDNCGYSILDFDHNSWYPNLLFNWPVGSYANLAAAYAGLPATTALFSGYTKRHEQDNITTINPWTTTITLGTNYRTAMTPSTPTLAAATAPKNSGVVIANITDGFSGAAPDRGAIIAGRSVVTYGDTSLAAPTAIRIARRRNM